jgi:hypothetical protein
MKTVRGHATLGKVFEDGAAVAEDLPPFDIGHPGFAAGEGADVHGAGPFWGWLYVPILSVRALQWGESGMGEGWKWGSLLRRGFAGQGGAAGRARQKRCFWERSATALQRIQR